MYVCLYNQLHIVDIKQFSFCLLNITTGVYITKPKKKKKIENSFLSIKQIIENLF